MQIPVKIKMRSFLCWMVATMLLAVSMGSRQVSFETQISSVGTITQEDLNETSPSSAGNEQTTVSALSLDAVVISLFSYHFSQYFLPGAPVSVRFTEIKKDLSPARFSEPLFFFCYFHKVFGKQIAANAP